MKYLDGQPLVGVNPEPGRWDGMLLPFGPEDLESILEESPTTGADEGRDDAEARLSDGQVLRGVNDLFIGPRTHTSALYEIELGERRESALCRFVWNATVSSDRRSGGERVSRQVLQA